MSEGIREVTYEDRLWVASYAEELLDAGDVAKADRLFDAVRCCGEFPECSHMLAYIETRVVPS